MRKKLVNLADKFDREGKADLADAVDSLLSTAARPRAPLKSLDDDVKRDLLKFIHRVKENLDNSMRSLEEFFRRLRYFDIGETVRDLKLDKSFKELARISVSIDAAGKAMYALTHGKHPSKADLEQLAEDFGSEKEHIDDPLDFFKSQSEDPTPEKDLIGLDEEDELLGSFVAGPDGVKETTDLGLSDMGLGGAEDEEYIEFMRGLGELGAEHGVKDERVYDVDEYTREQDDEEEIESFEDEEG